MLFFPFILFLMLTGVIDNIDRGITDFFIYIDASSSHHYEAIVNCFPALI